MFVCVSESEKESGVNGEDQEGRRREKKSEGGDKREEQHLQAVQLRQQTGRVGSDFLQVIGANASGQ